MKQNWFQFNITISSTLRRVERENEIEKKKTLVSGNINKIREREMNISNERASQIQKVEEEPSGKTALNENGFSTQLFFNVTGQNKNVLLHKN